MTCSNRGNCDTKSGLCKCYFQLTNANCDTYKSKMPVNYLGKMSADVMQLEIKNLKYGDSYVTLHSADVNNAYFRVIKAVNEAGDVFILDGLGNIVMSKGGLTIGRPEYMPAGRGLTIAAGGLRLTGGVTIHSKGLVATGAVHVRNGGATVASGGLLVEGGMTVRSGLQVAGGFTSAHALYIPTAVSRAQWSIHHHPPSFQLASILTSEWSQFCRGCSWEGEAAPSRPVDSWCLQTA